MTELEALGLGMGEAPPPYMIFVVVSLFFLTGLLGFLICHLLKKKGYRCRTGDIDDDEEDEENLGVGADDEDEENQDTVEQILKCIIENEANVEAFNEMLGNSNVCVRHDPRLRKESIGGVPPHHHTVHSGMDHNSCHLCAKIYTKKGRRQSRTPRVKQKPEQQTVFSVGRFRVIHTDKKPQGSPNPLAISGEQLDQSQNNEERKEGVYNLRSMFKDVRPPSESANGVAGNVGKRRKSLTIFGLRRGSDPASIKTVEETGRETGGLKFAIQQQPLVLEPVQMENVEPDPENITTVSSKPKTKTTKNKMTPSPEHEASNCDSFSQCSKQPCDSSSASEEGAELGTCPKSYVKVIPTTSTASSTRPAPSSLPIPSKIQIDGDDPGPLQTSTPIAPMPGSIPSTTPVITRDHPKSFSSTTFPITQTPPDSSLTFDLEPGANLVLISLGSSPPSSFQSKNLSSVSSLKSSTSDLAIMSSPELSSRNMLAESAKTVFSPTIRPSPKLLSNDPILSSREMSNQSLISSSAFGQSAISVETQSPLPSPSASQVLSSLSLQEQEVKGASISKTEGKIERKSAEILKTSKTSSVAPGDPKLSAFSFSSDQPSKDRLSTLSPSSPQGIKISCISIVKACPDSQRQFSVVTMTEEVEYLTSTKDHNGETSELRSQSEQVHTAVIQEGENSVSSVGQPEGQSKEKSGVEGQPTVSQDRDDMVEMEDISDCKVMLMAGPESKKEEVEKMVETQPEHD